MKWKSSRAVNTCAQKVIGDRRWRALHDMLSVLLHGETDHKVWLCLLLTKRLLQYSEMGSCSDMVGRWEGSGLCWTHTLVISCFAQTEASTLFCSDSIPGFHSWGVLKTHGHADDSAQIDSGIAFLIYESWVSCIEWLTHYRLLRSPAFVQDFFSFCKQVFEAHGSRV